MKPNHVKSVPPAGRLQQALRRRLRRAPLTSRGGAIVAASPRTNPGWIQAPGCDLFLARATRTVLVLIWYNLLYTYYFLLYWGVSIAGNRHYSTGAIEGPLLYYSSININSNCIPFETVSHDPPSSYAHRKQHQQRCSTIR